MKYYMLSKHLSDKDADKFIMEHEGCRFTDENFLEGPIVRSLPADVDTIVCYQEDANRYSCFGKKIITVENSEA